MINSLRSVMRNELEGWSSEVSKDFIAQKVARNYYKLKLDKAIDAQNKTLLKHVGADDKNNTQNFDRYSKRISLDAKATIMDLLPAILKAMPAKRAVSALNQFLNPLGFSVAAIGANNTMANRDQILAAFSKESSEAFRSLLLLKEHASIDQLRAAYKEVQESEGAHEPLINYLESLISQKG